MEQAVWLFVGVVSVIIAIGIVYKAMDSGIDNRKLDEVVWAVDKLETNLNFVCKAPVDTKIATEVRLPSGSVMTAQDDKLCITLDQEVRCRFINCGFGNTFLLDLNTEIALKSFDIRPYNCLALRTHDGIEIECQG